jgi:RNA polymerase sigma-70 factor (ECF subfamily)
VADTSLREAFLSQVAPALRAAVEAQPTLDAELAALVARARQAHPALVVEDAGFLAFVAPHVAADTALPALHAGDLLLAFACLLGDPEALAVFERDVVARAAAVVKGALPAGLTLDEVLQRLRVRLLVRQGERAPALATYSGKGSLVHWSRATAARLVQEFARTNQREVATDDADLADTPALTRDLDAGLLKQQFAAAFKEAFQAALTELSPKDQNLLRLHYLEGMRAEELGRIYDTHRTTVWRWLTQCREELMAKTRKHLATRVPEAELSSLMNVVHSQLDVSLSRVLKKREGT